MPTDLFALSPKWKNFTENSTTVQFNHRHLVSPRESIFTRCRWNVLVCCRPSSREQQFSHLWLCHAELHSTRARVWRRTVSQRWSSFRSDSASPRFSHKCTCTQPPRTKQARSRSSPSRCGLPTNCAAFPSECVVPEQVPTLTPDCDDVMQ